MERLENKEYISTVLLGAFFMLLMFNTFTVTKLPIQDIAFVTMAWTQYLGLFILGYYLQKRKGFDSHTRLSALGIAVFAGGYTLTYILGSEVFESADALSDVWMVLIFVIGMAQIKWHMGYMKIFALIATAFMFVFFLQWMHQGFPTFQYQSSIRNPNIFGALVAVLLYFPIVRLASAGFLQRLYLSAGIVTGLFLIYMSSARSALLLVFIALVAKMVSLYSKKIFNLLFPLLIIFNLILVVTYGWLYKSRLFISLNEWSLEHFGKQIFSGRQEIWESGIQYALEKPLFGHFIGIVPKDFIANTEYVHAHNQFLQVFLESGLVGLVCFIFMLTVIWRTFLKNMDSTLSVWSACFYLGILFYQNFEISLFGNIQAVGLFQWLIISIGLGACMMQGSSKNNDV